MTTRPLTVAWISDFPVEWLREMPENIRSLPRQHPSTWQRVLLEEFEGRPDLKLHVICLRKGIEKDLRFERKGVTFHVLKTIGGLRLASLFWQDTFLIRRLLKKISPDLVHAWGTERGAALVGGRLDYPFLITMQGLMGWCAEIVRLPFYFRMMVHLEKYALKRAQVVTVESRFGVEYLKQRFPNLILKQVEHAPARLFHQIDRKPDTGPFRFLFVGTQSEIKGTDLLLAALDRLQSDLDFRLTLIGGPIPEFKPTLEKWLQSSLGKRIDHMGSLSSAQIAEQLARCTLMIFPTRADNSPNSVKEAVVAGVPIVASRIGGIPDYVVPGKNGLLFSGGNLAECTEAIKLACEHSLFSKGLVDEDTLADKRTYLSPAAMSQRFREAYDSVAQNPR